MNFKRRKKIIPRSNYRNSNAKLPINMTAIALSILMMIVIWIGALKLIPNNPYLYKDYLLASIPLYKTIVPREEDLVRDNFSLATLQLLLGVNLTKPTSMIQRQIPVFSQFEYVKVVTPPITSPVDPPPIEEPQPPIEQPQNPSLEGINIFIYHSHSTEAFVATSGMTHTVDFSQSIVKVGEELTKALTKLGANVIHDKTHHDKKYSESYRVSRETVKNALEMDIEFDLIIDLHRDAVGLTSEVGRPRMTATIDDVKVGRLLFVIGGRHDKYRNNLILAQRLNTIAESLYPGNETQGKNGLTRGVVTKQASLYNQDLDEKMILVEIGGHWNTLEEAINTTGYLAEIIQVYFSQQ